MEEAAVVVGGRGQGEEIGARPGAVGAEQLQLEVAHVGVEGHGHDGEEVKQVNVGRKDLFTRLFEVERRGQKG